MDGTSAVGETTTARRFGCPKDSARSALIATSPDQAPNRGLGDREGSSLRHVSRLSPEIDAPVRLRDRPWRLGPSGPGSRRFFVRDLVVRRIKRLSDTRHVGSGLHQKETTAHPGGNCGPADAPLAASSHRRRPEAVTHESACLSINFEPPLGIKTRPGIATTHGTSCRIRPSRDSTLRRWAVGLA